MARLGKSQVSGGGCQPLIYPVNRLF